MSELCPPKRLEVLGEKAGLSLSSLQIDQLQTYLSQLSRWNRTINLTSLSLEGFPEQTLNKLIGEPLICASMLEDKALEWTDLGSGGGSPALPMRVVLSGAALRMVEARSRKVAFLRDAARTMGLSGVEVLNVRVEELGQQMAEGAMDLITLRALKLDQSICLATKRLAASSAQLALFGQSEWPLLSDAFELVKERDGIQLLRRIVPRETSGLTAR